MSATTPPTDADVVVPPRRWWTAVGAVIGAGTGLLPHLLHHVSLLAGTALLAGLGGTVLFAVLGLAAMLPLLIRLRRRFANWWAPAIALATYAVMFAVSSFAVGPAVRGATTDPPPRGPAPSAPASTGDHTRHHG